MANSARAPSHYSQTPVENNFPNPRPESFSSISGTGGVNGGQPQKVVVTVTPPSRRPRGRPLGSKNKPKAPILMRQQREDTPTTVVIEIPPGNDVIETIIAFAHGHHVGITVVSGTGFVSDVTLCHHVPSSRGSVFPIHGTFRILSLTGSYVIGDQFRSFFSSSFSNPTEASSFFGISLVGSRGQAFGGVIGGHVMAVTAVLVNAIIFKKPRFFRVSFINGDFFDEECGDGEGDDAKEDNNSNNNNATGGVTNFGHHFGGVKIVSNGITNNMSAYGVAHSSAGHHMNAGKVTVAKKNVM